MASKTQQEATRTARAAAGDRVRVQCLVLRKDGSNPEPDRGRQVLCFTVGSREAIPGISFGVVGMAEGEERHFNLQPWEAYGPTRERLVRQVPRRRFPARLDLRVGGRITARTPWGRRRMVVVALDDENVTVDWNHPLAGEALDVEVQLISLERGTVDVD
jgi:FKBP-type peptidyl-prolyl cis-trans isomerase 2